MKLEITRGTTMSLILTIQNDDGTIYHLKRGRKAYFWSEKFDIESDEYLIKKIITAENREENGYLISLRNLKILKRWNLRIIAMI